MSEPINIEGSLYYTIREFAYLTNRGEQSVKQLIVKGNRMRKLSSKYFFNKLFIPAEELVKFPFTSMGRSQAVFHFDKNGVIVE